MRTIHKFHVTPGHMTKMPKNAEILSAHGQGLQREAMHVWAIVDTDAPIVERWISVYGTGHELPPDIDPEDYIGTAHEVIGSLVFHFFDHGEVET